MRKVILIISGVMAIGVANAQSPDFGFETWNNVQFSTSIKDPQGWASLNTLNAVTATALSVTKETSAPAAGAISAKITTVEVSGAQIPNPYQPGNIDTAGFLAIGRVSVVPSPGLSLGYNYTWRPTILSFQSKYQPMAGDSAFVVALLTRWNGTSRDTIAWGKYVTGTSSSAYALNSIQLTFNPSFATVFPDSEQVFISSSVYNHDGAKIGSSFYIDDLQWTGWNSVENINYSMKKVEVYPNPSSNSVNFKSDEELNIVEVCDVSGRLLASYDLTQRKTIETDGLKPGIYLYRIYDNKKLIINRGRFEVVH